MGKKTNYFASGFSLRIRARGILLIGEAQRDTRRASLHILDSAFDKSTATKGRAAKSRWALSIDGPLSRDLVLSSFFSSSSSSSSSSPSCCSLQTLTAKAPRSRSSIISRRETRGSRCGGGLFRSSRARREEGKRGRKQVLTTTATEKRGKNQGKHTPSTHFVHDFFCSVAAEYRRYVVAPCSSLFLLAKNSASRAPSSPGEEQAPDPQRERLLARWRRLCF